MGSEFETLWLTQFHLHSDRDHTQFQVLAGETDITNVANLIEASQVIEHEGYDDWELWNDIVIVKLSSSIEYNDRQRPISLPVPNFYVASGHATVLAGWGDLEWGTRNYPDILQAVTKPAMTNGECQSIYTEEEILPYHICAGEYGRDACQGNFTYLGY